jgi:membrane-associated phospholipid phosphatase
MTRALLAVWLLFASVHALPARAQAPDSARASGGEPLFGARDALWAGGFVLGTLALAPVDVHVAAAVQDSALQDNLWIRRVADGLEFLGWPGATLVTAGMYAAGRLTDQPTLADMGLHTLEAVVLAEAVTAATKVLAGRARPHVNVRDPHNFRFARGIGGDAYQSFPSGHTTAAFATASAITAELALRSPGLEVPVGVALYGAATLIGISRLYHNQHWASDVMMGAAIGSFGGWKVVQYTHDNPDNRVDRWLLGVSLVPTERGRVARFWIAPGR